jgi:hypothetical protein
MPHVGHLFAGSLPEADEAVLGVAIWLDNNMPADTHRFPPSLGVRPTPRLVRRLPPLTPNGAKWVTRVTLCW